MAQAKETGDRLIERFRRKWPNRDATSAELVIRLYRLRDLIWSRSLAQARRFGLTWGEFEALAALWSGEPPFHMTPTEINGLMLVTSGGLSKILHNLEARGLVHRAGNEADGRSCFFALTDDGFALIEAMIGALTAESEALFGSALSENEQRRLLRVMEKLTRAAEQPGASLRQELA